jgi:hypothetical protein
VDEAGEFAFGVAAHAIDEFEPVLLIGRGIGGEGGREPAQSEGETGKERAGVGSEGTGKRSRHENQRVECSAISINLKTEMAEGESAAVIGPTRHPASRVASPFRCNRCEPESLVEPSTTLSSSLSIPVSRINIKFYGPFWRKRGKDLEEEEKRRKLLTDRLLEVKRCGKSHGKNK